MFSPPEMCEAAQILIFPSKSERQHVYYVNSFPTENEKLYIDSCFHLPAPSHFWEMLKNENMFYVSWNKSCTAVNSDAIWRHRSESTLAQVMAWCLTAPSHYLNQYWFLISVQWHSSESNFTVNSQVYSVSWVWKLYFKDYCHMHQGPMG